MKSHTCQIASKLSQVSVEVIKLDLCSQEDILRFRKWEHTVVCAGVLVKDKKSAITIRIKKCSLSPDSTNK